jgi:hypothetical protein
MDHEKEFKQWLQEKMRTLLGYMEWTDILRQETMEDIEVYKSDPEKVVVEAKGRGGETIYLLYRNNGAVPSLEGEDLTKIEVNGDLNEFHSVVWPQSPGWATFLKAVRVELPF